jgi:hypothetical protein
MTRNAQQEEEWINAWSDLYEFLKVHPQPFFLLPHWTETDLEGFKGWLQDSAYTGWKVALKLVWYKGGQSIQAVRTKAQ